MLAAATSLAEAAPAQVPRPGIKPASRPLRQPAAVAVATPIANMPHDSSAPAGLPTMTDPAQPLSTADAPAERTAVVDAVPASAHLVAPDALIASDEGSPAGADTLMLAANRQPGSADADGSDIPVYPTAPAPSQTLRLPVAAWPAQWHRRIELETRPTGSAWRHLRTAVAREDRRLDDHDAGQQRWLRQGRAGAGALYRSTPAWQRCALPTFSGSAA